LRDFEKLDCNLLLQSICLHLIFHRLLLFFKFSDDLKC
jgi:hypothetical protein